MITEILIFKELTLQRKFISKFQTFNPMTVTTAGSFSTAIYSLSLPKTIPRTPTGSFLCSNSFKPISASKSNPILSLSGLSVRYATAVAPKRSYRALAVFACGSRTYPEAESNDSNVDGTINLNLPRRSLLVQFTCGECGERTKRLINRLAYEKGLVFVQCAGCLQYHKLADNLGLVTEYDLRDEM